MINDKELKEILFDILDSIDKWRIYSDYDEKKEVESAIKNSYLTNDEKYYILNEKYDIWLKDWVDEHEKYIISYGGNFGNSKIIVLGKKSQEILLKELNEKYNKNKINVTFDIEIESENW